MEEPRAVAMRTALEAFIRMIEPTDGSIRPGRRTISLKVKGIVEIESHLPVPVGGMSSCPTAFAPRVVSGG